MKAYASPSPSPSGGFGYDDLPELMRRMSGDEKHDSSSTSTLDVLWVLYDRVLSVTPETAMAPSRDRFLLSKGHGPMAYYAVLAAKRFIDVDALPTYGGFDSPLGHHPDRALLPGVEISSGSLGHGLPMAVGLAYGLGVRSDVSGSGRVFCLVGDAELDEGSNHEAIVLAGRLELERLTVVVVDNDSSTHGWPHGVAARFELEGWSGATVDGRDHETVAAALEAAHPGQPRVVVARVLDR